MRVLFTGSREWRKNGIIRNVLRQLIAKYGAANIVVIHGKAKRGADLAVNNIASELGLTQDTYPADWDTHGLAAGPIRNQQMLDESNPEMVIAFHIGTSGTQDMINRAFKAQLPIAIYNEQGKAEKHFWKDI